MNYSIGEFAQLTNIGIYTLRYYEQEGLISPIRNENNRRKYSHDDIAWITFIKRLKETGMPIKEIKKYSHLRQMGTATLQERLDMLTKHQQTLQENISQLQKHMMKLDEKIIFYNNEIIKESKK